MPRVRWHLVLSPRKAAGPDPGRRLHVGRGRLDLAPQGMPDTTFAAAETLVAGKHPSGGVNVLTSVETVATHHRGRHKGPSRLRSARGGLRGTGTQASLPRPGGPGAHAGLCDGRAGQHRPRRRAWQVETACVPFARVGPCGHTPTWVALGSLVARPDGSLRPSVRSRYPAGRPLRAGAPGWPIGSDSATPVGVWP